MKYCTMSCWEDRDTKELWCSRFGKWVGKCPAIESESEVIDEMSV